MGARRQLPGCPHHPQLRRALGPDAAARRERIIGRQKASGALLSGGYEGDIPISLQTRKARPPLDAHIRLANPRTKEARKNLILRRPFNYSNGITKANQLDQGLLFIAYQNDLDRGFIAVQQRLDGEPLEEYIKPVGGGFFFTLPGVVGGLRFSAGDSSPRQASSTPTDSRRTIRQERLVFTCKLNLLAISALPLSSPSPVPLQTQ